MNWKVIAMAAALAGTPAAAEAAENCAVSVDFGSFCCGIDREAYEAAKAFADESPLVAGQSERAYGMEGEKVLCLQARSSADAKAIYAELRKRIGGKKGRGPVKVSMGGPR
jgi:hypothetical protein